MEQFTVTITSKRGNELLGLVKEFFISPSRIFDLPHEKGIFSSLTKDDIIDMPDKLFKVVLNKSWRDHIFRVVKDLNKESVILTRGTSTPHESFIYAVDRTSIDYAMEFGSPPAFLLLVYRKDLLEKNPNTGVPGRNFEKSYVLKPGVHSFKDALLYVIKIILIPAVPEAELKREQEIKVLVSDFDELRNELIKLFRIIQPCEKYIFEQGWEKQRKYNPVGTATKRIGNIIITEQGTEGYKYADININSKVIEELGAAKKYIPIVEHLIKNIKEYIIHHNFKVLLEAETQHVLRIYLDDLRNFEKIVDEAILLYKKSNEPNSLRAATGSNTAKAAILLDGIVSALLALIHGDPRITEGDSGTSLMATINQYLLKEDILLEKFESPTYVEEQLVRQEALTHNVAFKEKKLESTLIGIGEKISDEEAELEAKQARLKQEEAALRAKQKAEEERIKAKIEQYDKALTEVYDGVRKTDYTKACQKLASFKKELTPESEKEFENAAKKWAEYALNFLKEKCAESGKIYHYLLTASRMTGATQNKYKELMKQLEQLEKLNKEFSAENFLVFTKLLSEVGWSGTLFTVNQELQRLMVRTPESSMPVKETERKLVLE